MAKSIKLAAAQDKSVPNMHRQPCAPMRLHGRNRLARQFAPDLRKIEELLENTLLVERGPHVRKPGCSVGAFVQDGAQMSHTKLRPHSLRVRLRSVAFK
eukprot:5943264-Pleurochrysis_carterae.AAC.1